VLASTSTYSIWIWFIFFHPASFTMAEPHGNRFLVLRFQKMYALGEGNDTETNWFPGAESRFGKFEDARRRAGFSQ
jgi:hypothetical protein